MARYSRRTGPPSNFELTATDQVVPGLTITRNFDDGEVLLHARIGVLNATAGVVPALIQLNLDGVGISGTVGQFPLTAGQRTTIQTLILITLTAGRHTIDVAARGVAAVGDAIDANTGKLLVIQFPLWDQDTDIL